MDSLGRTLELEQLSFDAWRLIDRSVAPNDPAIVLAYVERTPAGPYEMVWVRGSLRTETFATLGDLLEAAVVRLGAAEALATT